MTKKPFKVFSTTAMAAAFAVSAIVPVAAAETPAEATLEVSAYVVNIDGKLVTLTVAEFTELKAGDKVAGSDALYVHANGNFYTVTDFTEAKAALGGSPTQAEVLKVLADENQEQDIEVFVGEVGADGTITAGDSIDPVDPVEEALAAATAAVEALPEVADVAIADKDAVADAAALVAAAKALEADVADLEATLEALTDKIAALEAALEAVSVESVMAINSTSIEATFNKAVSNDATVQLRRDGGAVVNVSELNFSEDRKSATLVLPNKFASGDYTVTLVDGEVTSSFEVKLAEEKVEKISIASDVAISNSNTAPTVLTVGYQVLNQYGEDITDDTTVSGTTSQGVVTSAQNGVLTLTGTYQLDSNVTVSLLHGATGTFVSKSVKVSSEAKVASFEVKGLYHADGTTPRQGNSTAGYSLLFKAVDQYGNALDSTELGTAGTEYVANSSNGSVANLNTLAATDLTVDKVEYISIPLTNTTFGQGTTTFNLISTTTGKSVNTTVEVPAALAVAKLTLGAPEIAVADEAFRLPFTALDQDGNAVTNLNTLNAVNFTIANAPAGLDGTDVVFKKDFVTGEIYLEVDADATTVTANTSINLIATPSNGQVAQRTINLRPNAQAASVSGIENLEKSIAASDVVTLTAANLAFKDQYGRDMAAVPTIGDALGNYQVKVISSGSAVVVTNDTLKAGNNTVTLTAAATKGSANITISLLEVTSVGPVVTKPIANSSYRYAATVTEAVDFASLELGTIATLNDGGALPSAAGFADFDLLVYGVDANGNRSLIPAADITVTSTANVLAYDNTNRELSVATPPTYATNVNVADVNFIVSAHGKSVNGVVKVSKEAQVVTTLSLDKAATAYTRINDSTLSIAAASTQSHANIVTHILANLDVTDQYGAEIITPGLTATNVTTSNYKDAAGKTVTTLAGPNGAAVAGGSYDLTVLLPSGKTQTFNVKVTS